MQKAYDVSRHIFRPNRRRFCTLKSSEECAIHQNNSCKLTLFLKQHSYLGRSTQRASYCSSDNAAADRLTITLLAISFHSCPSSPPPSPNRHGPVATALLWLDAYFFYPSLLVEEPPHGKRCHLLSLCKLFFDSLGIHRFLCGSKP